MTKKHVLLITHYYPEHAGGIELVAQQLALSLISSYGYTFTWISSDCDTPPEHDEITPLAFPTCNFMERRIGVPWPIWSPASWLRLEREIARADCVWLHDSLYLGNILAFLAAKWHKKPLLITQHIGLVPYRNWLLRWLMKFAKKYVGDQLLGRADRVVFISDRILREESQRISFQYKPLMIPNGVDGEMFQTVSGVKKASLRDTEGFDADKKILLFVGRFVEKKGLHILRIVAQALSGYLWIFAGNGPIVPERWRLKNVRVLRGLRRNELARVYQISDLLVLPSEGEGFPLVIQEAMACGLPVLCSSETAAGSEAARPLLHKLPVTENLIETAEIWRTEIIKLLSMEISINSKELAEFARQEWNWDNTARRYNDVLSSLI